MTRRDRKSSD
jgi:hypothetical protein